MLIKNWNFPTSTMEEKTKPVVIKKYESEDNLLQVRPLWCSGAIKVPIQRNKNINNTTEYSIKKKQLLNWNSEEKNQVFYIEKYELDYLKTSKLLAEIGQFRTLKIPTQGTKLMLMNEKLTYN